MPSWFWITFAVICVLSAGALIVFYREIMHVCKGEVQILGEENASVIYTKRFTFFLAFYVFMVVFLMFLTGGFYWYFL